MSNTDFIKLNGLLSKLNSATANAAKKDGTFKKYHTDSITALEAMQAHLQHLEQGLRTAKVVQ